MPTTVPLEGEDGGGDCEAVESSSCHSPCCAEKLHLTDKLLQAVLAEARVVCTGQPVLIAGDLNADLSVIPCLAKVISEGRFVDLALAYSLGEEMRPAATCKFKLDECSGTRRDFILGCSDAVAASTACIVTDRWFPLIFLCWLRLVLMVGLPRFPAPSFPSLCGPHAGLTLLIGLLHLYLVLFRMLGLCTKMKLVLYLLRLYLLCGMRCQGLRLMIFGPFGARLRRLVSLGRVVGRGGSTAAGSPAFLGRGLLRIRSWCHGGKAVGGMGSSGLFWASQGDEVDVHCSHYFVNSSLAPVVLFRRRLMSVADVLEGIRN